MNSLATVYDETKANKRLQFDADGITDTLMAPPCNLDINQIIHTPVSVVVKMDKAEYVKTNIGMIISHKYQVDVICKTDMIIFKDINARV